MQRSYPLRWLALAIGLLGTRCLDSISDDCTKTLTCDDQPPQLGADCIWRFPDGRHWEGGPTYDVASGRWRWPDGKETATQNLVCNMLGDAGGDAAGPDCRQGALCDVPLVCDDASGACVECIGDAECSANLPMGDAGAANVCDTARHECVRCLVNAHCGGDTPICKVDPTNSSNSQCVECTGDANCGGDAPVCDESTNECTTRCSATSECAGSDKPVCNVARQVCVECLDATTCTTATATQCDVTNNECVECIDDTPCAATGEVCDTTLHACVQCREDLQCLNGINATTLPYCELESKTCVSCLTDLQCTSEATSRCNPVLRICTGCTDNSQCEHGLLCRGGACVQCLDNSNCTNPDSPFCETVSGQCVQCLEDDSCLAADAAHCEVGQNATDRYECVGCEDNTDCAGKPGLGGLCRTVDGLCVDCITNAECSGDRTASQCGNGGTCERCAVDDDCDLFEGRPNCKVDEGCVGCVNDADCTGNPDGNTCKLNNNGTAQGPGVINTCVECVDNGDCLTPGAPVCSGNVCTACVLDTDCALIDSNGATAGGTLLNVCDAGLCVQCTGAKQTACGPNVCQSRTRTCSADRTPRSAGRCDDCVSDLECATDARCVQQVFDTTTVGDFCVPIPVGGSCASLRPYFGLANLVTLDTGVAAAVCTLRQTTCPGLAAQTADCDQDSDCGVTGLADGLCVAVDASTNQCTTPCDSANDCTGMATCDDGCSL